MPADVTDDAVLGGRLRLKQPKRGHRVGHDAILLAATCPAHAGERVVDLGAGVGAAGLALAARVAGIEVTLVEVDAELAALAAENAQVNGLAARVHAVVLDVAASARAFAAAGLGAESVERVLMNPPFNDPLRQRASADRQRRLAHAGPRGTLAVWTKTAARCLRPRGTLSLIWRAEALAEVVNALDAGLRRSDGAPGPWQARRGGNPRPGAGDQGKPRAADVAAGPCPHRRIGPPYA